MPEPIDFDITIVAASNVEAHVEATPKLDAQPAVESSWHLSGEITGPFCDRAHTLPATIPFKMAGAGDRVAVLAVIPDPCYWTRELPYLYRVRLDLQVDGETSSHEQSIGLSRQSNTGND